jgi:hypothetical protein
MSTIKPGLFWLIAPASLAIWMILVTPTQWLGIDTSALGTGSLLITVWIGFWISTRIPAERDAEVSPGELRNWIALIFTGLVAAVMGFNVKVITHADSLADLSGVGRTIAMLLIGWGIFSSIVRQRTNADTLEDERDGFIRAHADAWSHGTLIFVIIGLAVTLGFSPIERLEWVKPLMLAHVLIFSVVASRLVGHVIAVLQYRRAGP